MESGVKQNKKASDLGKRSIFSSIKTKILLLVIVVIALEIFLTTSRAVQLYEGSMADNLENNMHNIAMNYGAILDLELEHSQSNELTVERASDLLSQLKISGISTGYAYLVDNNGTMIYHPVDSKIGLPVENEVIANVIRQIQDGKIPESEVVSYVFNGATKYASYTIVGNGRYVVAVAADALEVNEPIRVFNLNALYSGIIGIVAGIILSLLISRRITAPILQLTAIVNKTADFNFEKNPYSQIISKRKDETGEIGRAIRRLRKNLREIVASIDSTSDKIGNNAQSLQEVSNHVNENSNDNSATTQELAAAMEETSAMTETIGINIESVDKSADNINQLGKNGVKLSNEIKKRAEDLKVSTVGATQKTREVFLSIQENTHTAIEKSKAVEKINELSGAIMQIARQTSLLALNASIEAARAGESGRGFSVVATEIGNLADQSAKTVSGITEIVDEVHIAVEGMVNLLEKTSLFLENTVLEDYANFLEVSNQYSSDANEFEGSMQNIRESIGVLATTIKDISESIIGINSTIVESTMGVTDVASKTSDIVELTQNNYSMVEESIVYSNELKGIVQKFKLE